MLSYQNYTMEEERQVPLLLLENLEMTDFRCAKSNGLKQGCQHLLACRKILPPIAHGTMGNQYGPSELPAIIKDLLHQMGFLCRNGVIQPVINDKALSFPVRVQQIG